MKYIMFAKNRETLVQYVPIIFPNELVHADVAKAMLAGPLEGFTADSAGELSPIDMQCHGKSETLGLKANSERDTRMIMMCDYGGQFE